jgi:hypothetical protein
VDIAEAEDARLKELNANLLRGRDIRSRPPPQSRLDGGNWAGEEGRLVGRRKDEVLMACIVAVCIGVYAG